MVGQYRARYGNPTPPEAVLIHDKASEFPDWQEAGDRAVADMRATWAALGLTFPDLTQA